MNCMQKITLSAALLTVSSAVFASSIAINPLSFFLNPTHRFNDIYVRNTGNDMAYVKVTPYRILHPGAKDQKLVKINFKDPYDFGLLVSPDKLVIKKGLTRSIRVVALPDLKQKIDKVYEIKVIPDEGQWVTIKTKNKHLKAGINVVQGFAAMVVVRPLNAHPNIILKREGTTLTIKNTGNTYARLYQAKQCIKSSCHLLKESMFPMYVGFEKKVTLPRALPVHFIETLPDNKTQKIQSN